MEIIVHISYLLKYNTTTAESIITDGRTKYTQTQTHTCLFSGNQWKGIM